MIALVGYNGCMVEPVSTSAKKARPSWSIMFRRQANRRNNIHPVSKSCGAIQTQLQNTHCVCRYAWACRGPAPWARSGGSRSHCCRASATRSSGGLRRCSAETSRGWGKRYKSKINNKNKISIWQHIYIVKKVSEFPVSVRDVNN